ncbi:hypothetical protein ACIP98_41585 [Streptomyces sp. NPDC088354]|uniref:hypothetical protein n=1 Tax=Streptomyces sp. NPDC088354 TaxID=3365856 RepID=UPI0037F8EA50
MPDLVGTHHMTTEMQNLIMILTGNKWPTGYEAGLLAEAHMWEDSAKKVGELRGLLSEARDALRWAVDRSQLDEADNFFDGLIEGDGEGLIDQIEEAAHVADKMFRELTGQIMLLRTEIIGAAVVLLVQLAIDSVTWFFGGAGAAVEHTLAARILCREFMEQAFKYMLSRMIESVAATVGWLTVGNIRVMDKGVGTAWNPEEYKRAALYGLVGAPVGFGMNLLGISVLRNFIKPLGRDVSSKIGAHNLKTITKVVNLPRREIRLNAGKFGSGFRDFAWSTGWGAVTGMTEAAVQDAMFGLHGDHINGAANGAYNGFWGWRHSAMGGKIPLGPSEWFEESFIQPRLMAKYRSAHAVRVGAISVNERLESPRASESIQTESHTPVTPDHADATPQPPIHDTPPTDPPPPSHTPVTPDHADATPQPPIHDTPPTETRSGGALEHAALSGQVQEPVSTPSALLPHLLAAEPFASASSGTAPNGSPGREVPSSGSPVLSGGISKQNNFSVPALPKEEGAANDSGPEINHGAGGLEDPVTSSTDGHPGKVDTRSLPAHQVEEPDSSAAEAAHLTLSNESAPAAHPVAAVVPSSNAGEPRIGDPSDSLVAESTKRPSTPFNHKTFVDPALGTTISADHGRTHAPHGTRGQEPASPTTTTDRANFSAEIPNLAEIVFLKMQGNRHVPTSRDHTAGVMEDGDL